MGGANYPISMFEIKDLNPKTAAILSLDIQNGILEFIPPAEKILPAAAKVLNAARGRGVPVLHVGLGYRAGYPEVPPDHPVFGMVRQSGKFIIGTPSAAYPAGLGAKADEIVVHKHRVSGFSGNDLEMILRAKGITQLVLMGIATSGIVLSTLRQAADLDFRCLVIEDACFDGDEEVHRVLTKKVFTRQANVITADAFAMAIS
jgi:nicotinamidase-related amidase